MSQRHSPWTHKGLAPALTSSGRQHWTGRPPTNPVSPHAERTTGCAPRPAAVPLTWGGRVGPVHARCEHQAWIMGASPAVASFPASRAEIRPGRPLACRGADQRGGHSDHGQPDGQDGGSAVAPLRTRPGLCICFWIGYIVTRPLGASMGDLPRPVVAGSGWEPSSPARCSWADPGAGHLPDGHRQGRRTGLAGRRLTRIRNGQSRARAADGGCSQLDSGRSEGKHPGLLTTNGDPRPLEAPAHWWSRMTRRCSGRWRAACSADAEGRGLRSTPCPRLFILLRSSGCSC
jgi:hypothetical protein